MNSARYDATIENDIETLRDAIRNASADSLVFFGGAGVSTESGIPDFRSADGLYAQKFAYPPETMLSRTFFDTHTPEFFDFYFDRVVCTTAQPNRAHKKLAQLETEGTLRAVITQNIDGLHQAAGSKHVYELHGSILRNQCMACGKMYDLDEMLELRKHAMQTSDGVPRCKSCNAVVKPDVVLYEEPLDGCVIEDAIRALTHARIALVAGTSLAVNPAASLLHYFNGDLLAIVNKMPTPYDYKANLVIPASIGDVLDF